MTEGSSATRAASESAGWHPSPHLAIFLPSLAGGGVARMMLQLAEALAGRGHRVELVLCRAEGPYLAQVPEAVKVTELRPHRAWRGRLQALRADLGGLGALLLPVLLAAKPAPTLPYLPSLVAYLRSRRPDALLAAKTPANLVALWARRLAGVPTRVVVSERTSLSHAATRMRKWRWRYVLPAVCRAYSWADAIVAVSQGVAEDLSRCAGIARDRIVTIYNPVVRSEILEKARAPLAHPWFATGAPPVVLGAGRLVPQKDFATLLRAFARIRATRRARLVILGGAKSGEARRTLETLAERLGVAEDVALPGFVENPFAYMARASVFALSSAWEGLPSVLVQAMACGCPVVSTDCPSGPAEILEGGAYGPLVPVGDDVRLARAIASLLDDPPDSSRLRARAARFSVEPAVEAYAEMLGLASLPNSRSGRSPGSAALAS